MITNVYRGNFWSALFKEKAKLWTVFFLGFSSGLPFLLILSTLYVWLTEAGVSKTQIGLFAWVTVTYTFKFLLAPLIETVRVPLLSRLLGKRRGWLLVSQIALLLSLIVLGRSSPNDNIFQTVIWAFVVGFFSALQDLNIEAYRVESLEVRSQGAGASASVLGYRLGMLFSGAGALYLAAFYSWQTVYLVMGLSMLVGIMATICSDEVRSFECAKVCKLDVASLYHSIAMPLKRLSISCNIKLILLFILCFKLSDTFLTVMSMPFLLEIGFNKVQIAHAAKTFGISFMILGGVVGGLYLQKNTLMQFLNLCCLFQFSSSLLFVTQAIVGKNLSLLFVSLGVENFTTGLTQVGLITYFSELCLLAHSTSFYAILTSFASFARVNSSVFAGWFADQLSWVAFYFLVSLFCIPTFLLLRKHNVWYEQKCELGEQACR